MTTPLTDRLLVLADRSRDTVDVVVRELLPDLERWADTVLIESTSVASPLPDADVAVVVGGDGAVISQARRLVGRGTPLIGVNCGRLGFLAAFDAESLRRFAEVVFGADPPIRQHMVMEVVQERNGDRHAATAVNDAVITAGPPYSMIELSMLIGGVPGPNLRGDGIIVSSPTGSTAHNLSAGGPIVGPGVDALVVSPLAPQSLAFRPIVLEAECGVQLQVSHANEGTTLVLDGQVHSPVQAGDRILVHRLGSTILMVTRPDEPFYRILMERMRWAAPPVFR